MFYGALNDVERVCRGVELIQFVSCASTALLCWISFLLPPLCLYPSERGQATNHQQKCRDQCQARLSTLSSYNVHAHARSNTHIHTNTRICCMYDEPFAKRSTVWAESGINLLAVGPLDLSSEQPPPVPFLLYRITSSASSQLHLPLC